MTRNQLKKLDAMARDYAAAARKMDELKQLKAKLTDKLKKLVPRDQYIRTLKWMVTRSHIPAHKVPSYTMPAVDRITVTPAS